MKKFATAVAAFALTSAVAWSAQAQMTGATGFGEKGTLALDAATGSPMLGALGDFPQLGAVPTFGFSTTTNADPEVCNAAGCVRDSVRFTALYIDPRIHYFIIDHLSIGGEVLLGSMWATAIHRDPNGTTTQDADAPNAIGIMPEVGYDIPLGDKFSLWPQGGIGFRHWWFTHKATNARDLDVDHSENWWFLNVDVPFLLHPTRNIAIGVGPGATFTLGRSQSSSSGGTTRTNDGYGTTQWRWLNAHIVGWF